MSLKNGISNYLKEITTKWTELQKIPNIFRYRLNISESKYLAGKHNFYAELNPERTSLRRAPQAILSLDPKFDDEKFNFKKINSQEIILTILYENSEISLLINNSPLTLYHSLIAPDVKQCIPQRITLITLKFCTEFLMSIEGNQHYRIGYNSPGALASVNHLHTHLMYIEKELYIDRAQLELIASPDIYRLSQTMPTEAICYIFNLSDSSKEIDNKLQQLYKFIMWLCDNNMPHNIFMTPERCKNTNENLKVFIYSRADYCIEKGGDSSINTGFCELSGYVPVGAKNIYDNLTEDNILQKINDECKNAYPKIYEYFKNCT